MKPELLAPAGNPEKLKTAFYYGADAVYCGGKSFSLRALSDNFSEEELKAAVEYTHSLGKKIYITANIFAFNNDFTEISEYFRFLESIGADGAIIADLGVIECCLKNAPKLPVHVSTQSNVTNKYAAKVLSDMGVARIVLARELPLSQIREIRDYISKEVSLEAFVHGAMCISYSGRCLISNVLTGRASNRGECVQACRWEYEITEVNRPNERLGIQEDGRGTYILNSKDLNMLERLEDLIEAGVSSFKIEGRMKTPYYVASVVNAYRRAIDGGCAAGSELLNELYKTGHRQYTTGFYYPSGEKGADTVFTDNSRTMQQYEFAASVIEYDEAKSAVLIEQRNRFREGDILEILSPEENFNKTIEVRGMTDQNGRPVADAKNVQQKLYLPTSLKLKNLDILRIKSVRA